MPTDCQPEDREEVKRVKEQLVKAKEAVETLREMARWQKPPKATAKLGIISASIYQKKRKTQTDKLSQLPTEIQGLIWSYLTDQPDRLMLALTCKWNAAVYESLKDVRLPLPSAKKKMSPKKQAAPSPASKQLVKTPRPAPISNLQRLKILDRLRLTSFIPKKYRLCYTCIRFLPRSYTAAARGKGKTSGFDWTGRDQAVTVSNIRPNITTKKLKEIISDSGCYRCPDCEAREAFNRAQGDRAYAEWKQVVGKLLKS